MKKVLVFAFLLGCVSFVNAKGFCEFHAGLSCPSGVFADDDYEDEGSGGATNGLDFGLKYYSPLNADGLFLTFGLDYMRNGLKSDVKDDIEDATDDTYSNADITFKKYVNIPLTVGLNLQKKLSEGTTFFGDAGLGLNFSMLTNSSIEVSKTKITEDYESKSKLCYRVGGGLIINERYVLELNYNILGSYRYKGEKETVTNGKTTTEDIKFGEALDIKTLSLTLGYKF